MNQSLSKTLRCGTTALFAILMGASAASAYDFSAPNKHEVTIYYNINPDGKTATVTYGSDKYKADYIEIPQEVTHDGTTYTVTTIGNRAFEQAAVREFKLPNTITEFQTNAFYRCNVSVMNFPSELKHIRNSALRETRITNCILPIGLETIEESSFNTVPLDTLYLPKTVRILGENAFYQTKITYLTIPGSIKTVPKSAFASSNTSKLKYVTIDEGVESLGVKPYDGSVFSQCPIESLKIPSTLKYIGPNCFNSNNLQELILPNTVEEIGEHCFTYSKRLKSITFSNGMTELPNFVCEQSTELINVNIPEGIKKIGVAVFGGAALLSHIKLPESVIEIEHNAFQSTGLVDFTFPKNLYYIGNGMFNRCDNLTEIVIPETINEIRPNAFSSCSNLRKVTLPKSLKILGDYAFSNCTSLTEINIPANIGILNQYLFNGCSALEAIIIPEGIKEIRSGAFEGCKNLTDIQLPKSLTSIYDRFISGCDALKNLKIYHNTSTIEQGAFNGCKTIEGIYLYRAVVPNTPIPHGWLVNRPVIGTGNNCTLYVPKGSAESYRESKFWNTFKAIEEIEVTEELNYQVTFPSSIRGGSLSVNGEASKTVMEFLMGSDVVITATPKEGYHLTALIVNGKDVTAELGADGSYTIKNLDANYKVDTSFAENPVMLSLFMADGGSIDLNIKKEQTFTCLISPEDNWKINTVTFNGRDVTAELGQDGTYTTPKLTGDSELRVTFESTNSAIENIVANPSASAKVYVDRNGLVTIEGLEAGSAISVYTVNGQLVDHTASTGSCDSIQLGQRGVYLVQTPAKTYKIQY